MIKILNVAYFMQMQSNTSQPTTPEELRLSFPDNGINVKWKVYTFSDQENVRHKI